MTYQINILMQEVKITRKRNHNLIQLKVICSKEVKLKDQM